jgi:DNA (cytosine-5)-methyltransferase 1
MPQLVSLYSGAGGLDYGFEAAGFETAVAIEMDRDCCATIRRNRGWPVIEDRIENVSSSRLLESGGLARGSVDLLIGGPPCQPFSKSSYWVQGDTLRLNDPRARTLYEYMRCVSDLLPDVFVLENVHGITYSGKEEGFLLLRKLADKINREHGTKYELSWAVLNAADFGVPQLRKRFFLVGHREGKRFAFPQATHASAGAASNQLGLGMSAERPYVTAWDALADVGPEPHENLELKSAWRDLLPSIPEGENYLWHTNRRKGKPLFGWRTRYWSFLLKLAKNLPSWTVQANPGPAIGPFHWKNRMLGVRELARIQTFPDSVAFVGKRASIQRQIGNAVPSLLAEVLGRAISEQFFGVRYTTAPRLALTPKRPIPPPEPTLEVPGAFLHLIGDHEPHPGTGRGRAAVRRAAALGEEDSDTSSEVRDARTA